MAGVVKLADGTLLVGSQTFTSPQRPMVGSNAFSGNFVVSEVTFDDQRWFQLDPVKVVTMKEVGNSDLSRVDEIGFVESQAWRRTRFCRMLQRLMDRGVHEPTEALRQPREARGLTPPLSACFAGSAFDLSSASSAASAAKTAQSRQRAQRLDSTQRSPRPRL